MTRATDPVRVLPEGGRVAVMAVVNRTPDSFYDKGATFALDRAVQAALRARADGADWIDIGGVPFGRGPAVSVQEEIDRVAPVVEAIRAQSDVIISVDTYRSEVARAVIAAGAHVINDTTGLGDEAMGGIIAESDAHLVITHSIGPPRVEKPPAHYDDVVAEVTLFLQDRVARAEAAGIPRARLIVDAGHDLDKNTLHTLELTRRFEEFGVLGLPLLAAVSNKDFIGESIDAPQGQRLEGSIAAMVVCIMKGARVVRMHDIPQSVAAARMTEAILGLRPPVRVEHNAQESNV
ncbi:MAG TPA: dihydropteroate synthase [Pseudolysinimonas sp.]|jgi:dihydropteroate synthase|nr:dihydropteroate synthase [Pseudolysinimonas sp.]